VESSGVKIINSPTLLDRGWKGDDGSNYFSQGRKWWAKLIKPDGSIAIPIEEEVE